MKKYKFIGDGYPLERILGNRISWSDDSVMVYRIQALRDFGDVKEGDLGGYLESENNLSQEGNCWVYDTSCVLKDARVYDNAIVCKKSYINNSAQVYGNSYVEYTAVLHNAKIFDNAKIYGRVFIHNDVKVYDNAIIKKDSGSYLAIYKTVNIYGNAFVTGAGAIYGTCKMHGNSTLHLSCSKIGHRSVILDVILDSGYWGKIIKKDRKRYLISHTLKMVKL